MLDINPLAPLYRSAMIALYKTFKLLKHSLFIIAMCLFVMGCDKGQSIEISNFSGDPLTVSHKKLGAGVVGVKISTEGALSDSLRMNISSDGKVLQTLSIPETGIYSTKLDWYDTILEVSFTDGENVTGTLIANFQFITL